jgi:hypothetical protein
MSALFELAVLGTAAYAYVLSQRSGVAGFLGKLGYALIAAAALLGALNIVL